MEPQKNSQLDIFKSWLPIGISLISLMITLVNVIYSIGSINNNTRVSQIEIDAGAPEVVVAEAQIKPIPDSKKKVLSFQVKNIGNRTAKNVYGTAYFIYADGPCCPFMKGPVDFSNGIPPGEAYSWYFPSEEFTPELPPFFIAIKIQWNDALDGKVKEAEIFLKWKGLEEKIIHWTLGQATSREREVIKASFKFEAIAK